MTHRPASIAALLTVLASLSLCVACRSANEPPKAEPPASATGSTNGPPSPPSAAPAGVASSSSAKAAPPGSAAPSTEGSCDELRERFYAYQAANLACSRDEECECVARLDVNGGLLGVRAAAEPPLRAVAAAYSKKGCPIGGRATSAPVCKAHCASGACAP